MSCHCGYSKPDAIHIEPALAAEPTVVDEVNAPKTQEPPPVTSTPREVTALDPKKGKKSRATGGYLGAVGGARFYAEHQLIFRNVTHALNLHWAANGEYPKTHEEFMEKIINFNQIQLPELDPGVEYIYDPEDHTLKIHKPGDEPRSEDSSDP